MKRDINSEILKKINASTLYRERIKEDCERQNVFFAIRGNEIDLYHKGGRLFCFDRNGFKTHYKYASLLSKLTDDYLSENELSKFEVTHDFVKTYPQIKENCSKFSGVEAEGVSSLYHGGSYLSENEIEVLDIAVSFKSYKEGKKQARIDILLYNRSSKSLQFVEAKHFSNKEIWSTKEPKVINQIKRYEKQIDKRKQEILREYSTYVLILNRMFGIDLPQPEKVEDAVTLLIFGFDNDQKYGRLETLVTKNKYFNGIKCYAVGDIKGKNVIKGIWNAGMINA